MIQVDKHQPTVIIAAHNESYNIASTLNQLINSNVDNDDRTQNTKNQPSKYQTTQIIVVCNGCSDGTEQVVRDDFPQVHCLSISQASKALAIRHAESFNPGFPRLYLDADIGMNMKDVDRLIELGRESKKPRLIIPASVINTKKSSNWVKSFYHVWYLTPHVQRSGYGAGAYLINHAARARFGLWPELMADDTFIRQRFEVNEIYIEKNIKVKVNAPRTLWSLIKVKTRTKYGNIELSAYNAKFTHDTSAKPGTRQANNNTDKTTKAKINNSSQQRSGPTHVCWQDKLIYLFINLIALTSAKLRFSTGNSTWLRDNSNR